jgi:hypothetical protein
MDQCDASPLAPILANPQQVRRAEDQGSGHLPCTLTTISGTDAATKIEGRFSLSLIPNHPKRQAM